MRRVAWPTKPRSRSRSRLATAAPVGWRALVVAGLLLAIGLVPGVGTAATADGDVKIDAELGFGGQVLIGRSAAAVVKLSSPRLVRATLVVAASQSRGPFGSFSVRQPIEIPAGAAKQVALVVPTQFTGGDTVQIDVSLDVGGTTVASTTASGQTRPDVELVGLAGSLAADRSLPETTNLAIDAGTARFVAVSDELLDLAGALDPLDQLALTAADLGAMPPARRARLLTWVGEGGRLLVRGAADGALLDGLPAAWQPGSARRSAAGMGEVSNANASDWWHSLEPTPTRSFAEDSMRMKGFGGFPIANRVAREAGLKVAKLGWLGAFLVTYVVFGGLVVPLIVRRVGRPFLIWSAVPALALVFTAGAWLAGRSLRSGAANGHVSFVSATAAGSTIDTWIGAVAKGGGSLTVTLPDGWTQTSTSPFFGGPGESIANQALTISPQGARLGVDLAAGEFGMVQARGPAPAGSAAATADPFELSAHSDSDGVVVGTIRNTSAHRMEQVAVFADQSGTLVGTLEPQAQKDFEITGTDSLSQGQPVEAIVWPGASGFNGMPDVEDPAVVTALSEVETRLGGNDRAAGTVQAVGWASDVPALLSAGSSAPSGRTGFMSSSVVATGAHLTDASIRRAVVRAPGIGGGIGPSAEVVYSFTLPPTVAVVPRLSARIPDGVSTIEVWNGSAWVQLDVASGQVAPARAEPSQPSAIAPPPTGAFRPSGAFATIAIGPGGIGGGSAGGTDRLVPLPADVVRAGRVFVRTPIIQGPFGLGTVYLTEAPS